MLKNNKMGIRSSRFIQFFQQKTLHFRLSNFSLFCVQNKPEIEFSTSESLENKLEWLQISNFIVGPHNLPFFGPEKQVIGDVLFMKLLVISSFITL